MVQVEVEEIARRVRIGNRVYQWIFLAFFILTVQLAAAQWVAGGALAAPLGDEGETIGLAAMAAFAVIAALSLAALVGFRFSAAALIFANRSFAAVVVLFAAAVWFDVSIRQSDGSATELLALGGVSAALLALGWPRLPALSGLWRGVGPLRRGEWREQLQAIDRFRTAGRSERGAGSVLRRRLALGLQAIGVAALALFVFLGLLDTALEDAGLRDAPPDALTALYLERQEDVSAIVLVGGLTLYLLGRFLGYRDGRRLLAGNRPIAALFLRSFADDQEKVSSTLLFWRLLTFGLISKVRVEEALGRDLSRLGAFVGVGQPGERLPKLGAARVYAEDDEWQELVKGLIDRSQAILLMAGASHWVAWEAAMIAKAQKLERTLILLPHDSAADRRAALANLAEQEPRLRPIAEVAAATMENLRAVHLTAEGATLYRAASRTDMVYRVAQALFIARLGGAPMLGEPVDEAVGPAGR